MKVSWVVKLNDDATMNDLLVWFELFVRTRWRNEKEKAEKKRNKGNRNFKQVRNMNKNEKKKEGKIKEENRKRWMIRK